jgi:hypothetical protein
MRKGKRLYLTAALVFLLTWEAFAAVCTEFNKSGCDDETVCQAQWGIYSERYAQCLQRKRAETRLLEKKSRRSWNPFRRRQKNPSVVVIGQNNIVTAVQENETRS